MTTAFDQNGICIYHGNALDVLSKLPDESVNCCVTSPPYWGLRDYGVEGQLGLERTPEEYVANMVAVFREVRRVLRDDGTLWVNVGDSYAGGGCGGGGSFAKDNLHLANKNEQADWKKKNGRTVSGYKPKDLVGIPWMLAFALRADGWYLRGDHVWGKPNGMPESVDDRPTRSHEYVFLLSKSSRYWYDAEAVRTAPKPSTETRLKQDLESQAGSLRANGGAKTNGAMKAVRRTDKQRGHSRRHDGFNDRWHAMERDEQMAEGANLRSVWWISTAQFGEAHFAVMPKKLARICILAGCPSGGTVLDPFCGAGTTLAVARDSNCRAIGVELNAEYIEIAARRLDQDAFCFPETA